MSRMSISLGEVEGISASMQGQLGAAGEATSQHLGAYTKISGDGSGNTVSSAQNYATQAKGKQVRVADTVQQVINIARSAAAEAVTIDNASGTRFV